MKLELSNQQFRELLKAVVVGVQIRESVGEEREAPGWEKIPDIEKHLLSVAKDFGAEDMAEWFANTWIPSDEVSDELDEEIEEYNNQEFWDRLYLDLAQRDFYRTMTKEEKKFISANDGLFPERMHELYRKYTKEFEKHGVGRIEIVEKRK